MSKRRHSRVATTLWRLCRLPWRVMRLIYRSAEATARNAVTALVQIWGNKVRSVLTVLGIIIAVTSTITVVSVVQGFGNYVTDFLKGIGTNSIWVVPQRPAGAETEISAARDPAAGRGADGGHRPRDHDHG